MIEARKYKKNPIIFPLLKGKEDAAYNPGAIVHQNQIFLLYRSERGFGDKAISEIYLAKSKDGFSFQRYKKNPVIKGERAYEKFGCEDPRVTKVKDEFFLTYTAYGGRDKKGDFKIKLMGAFSKDLKNWKKTSPLIDGAKSGGPVQDYKYKNSFVMYFGGEKIQIAFSKNLKKWKVEKKPLILARKGNFFDNHLVEGGPPAILTKDGIFLIYNGKNKDGKFSVGFAIFDKRNPKKLLKRSKKPLLEPTQYWEKFGKVNDVIFATGLVYFNQKWLLYYGGADKSIGVATLKF